jgi:hypothetical protein
MEQEMHPVTDNGSSWVTVDGLFKKINDLASSAMPPVAGVCVIFQRGNQIRTVWKDRLLFTAGFETEELGSEIAAILHSGYKAVVAATVHEKFDFHDRIFRCIPMLDAEELLEQAMSQLFP